MDGDTIVPPTQGTAAPAKRLAVDRSLCGPSLQKWATILPPVFKYLMMCWAPISRRHTGVVLEGIGVSPVYHNFGHCLMHWRCLPYLLFPQPSFMLAVCRHALMRLLVALACKANCLWAGQCIHSPADPSRFT